MSLSTESAANRDPKALPPVILLGGGANALSIARSLARERVRVYAINDPITHIRHSRFATWLPIPVESKNGDPWAAFLLGEESEFLRGAVLLAACDDGIELIARHREALERKFILDLSNPDAQLCMLDKLRTYECAREAGVPTPLFWTAESWEAIEAIRDELVFPLIVKPVLSHQFQARFKAKYLLAGSFEELRDQFSVARDARIEVMLVEMIPGPDDLLCSYYTYLDEAGEPQFDFTKRILRRYPPNMGIASYHITDWNPEVKEVALRLFRHAGLRGLANAEFKRDERDGKLKLIECNARFTAGNPLVKASGFDLALYVYNRLTGRPQKPLQKYRVGKRLLDPVRDFRAYRELRKRGEITLGGWLKSLMHPQVWMWFQWDDPLPSLVSIVHTLRKMR